MRSKLNWFSCAFSESNIDDENLEVSPPEGTSHGVWGNQNLTSFSQSEVVSSNKMAITLALKVIFCKCNIY